MNSPRYVLQTVARKRPIAEGDDLDAIAEAARRWYAEPAAVDAELADYEIGAVSSPYRPGPGRVNSP